tara:strand:- start:1981 stop:5388 length:3408 start_codon:yes stop_codon:yes gene_type:complete
MRKIDTGIQLSASDLVGHLNCRHLTALDIGVCEGTLSKPHVWDPLLEILRERGRRHEDAFIQHLKDQGLTSAHIEGIDITPSAVAATREAMEAGVDVIIQAAMQNDRWAGRADVLRKVASPSDLGDWSYEVIDTKLARETKGGSVLQLCLYADLLEEMQGLPPENLHIVAPWSDFEPQSFRYADYAAFFRRAKAAAEAATSLDDVEECYPDPKAHCDVCRWAERCDKRRRDDDHLCLVANISKTQIGELRSKGITTTAALAEMPVPIPFNPERGSPASFEKAREQARIQIESRESGELRFQMLPVDPTSGLCLLPEPSDGDIFFDIEGDPFVGEHGLEYLFGYQYRDESGKIVYAGDWAFDRDGEKAIFERFVDFVTQRREQYPDLHIYHFAPYEPGALKRLMGRYATREDEIDNLLRGKVLVDLYSVVRNALRAGVESYSIKKLEPLYGYARDADLKAANLALASLQASLELGDTQAITDEDKTVVELYNRDDCASTLALRDWLEERRAELISDGNHVPRPEPGQDGPSEELSERQQRVQALVERLIEGIPVDPEARSAEQQATWVLAYLLDWHRREDKAAWWEYFRLAALTPEELTDERAALSGLELIATVDETARGIPTHRYRFPQQDTDLRGGETLQSAGGEKLGEVVEISSEDRTVDIKKMGKTASEHPVGVFAHTMYGSKEQADSLLRLGEYVADNGITGDGPYNAARALLLRLPPNLDGGQVREGDEDTLQAALRVATALHPGVFPIQGPPGTGKSFTGARMICELVSQGKRVGITANSHKVIRNLLDKVVEAAEEAGIDLRCVQKPKEMEPDQSRLTFAKDNNTLLSALASGRCQVAGATHFLWARADAQNTLDVLVVDEAAQMSLANVVAVAPSAERLVLLGDPQQLDQPTQGTHPDGAGVSCLEHVLGDEHTIAKDCGLFLENTWRLHPDISEFTSELFYDDKLASVAGCEQQEIRSAGIIQGSGLRYLPVDHAGNQSSSIEEAEAVASLVNRILADAPTWIDRDGTERPVSLEDILIIAPYNAQVFEIQQRLPGARVGTVDKFQGQEAPIAIYSTATSSHADAPRGMEFLYSANRFNVATSRAKCVAILVASPQLFEAECRTPQQMQLANAFCRYLELAQPIGL